jgi:Rps23 Pro-64 3,4-dihydroxylase Tpa1-like proline 4-hydroxylase
MRHEVIEDYLDAETVAQINREWPSSWDKSKPSKFSKERLPPAAKKVADAVDLKMVERVTGIPNLIADPEMYGAGLHCVPTGQKLGMHVDFNQHPKGWARRVNMLVYLNERWDEAWGGYLQLGLQDPVFIAPVGGRCVIFETNAESWHGHPTPLKCPPSVQRRSLAMYFYTKAPPKEKARSTVYVA